MGVTAELAMLEVLACGWIKYREGPLGEEGGGVSAAGSGHGGDVAQAGAVGHGFMDWGCFGGGVGLVG